MSARLSRLGVLVLVLRLAGCGSDELSPSGQGGGSGDTSSGGSGASGGSGSGGATPGDGGLGASSGGRSNGGTDGGASSGGASDGGDASTGGDPASGGAASSGGNSGGGGPPSSGGNGGATDAGASNGGAGVDDLCATAEDCGDPATTVCDPVTRRCVPYQCTATLACAAGQACLAQAETVTGGACYTTCTPFGLACSGARECRQIRFDASLGICVGRGAGSAGQPCDPLDVVATGCVAGQDCVTEGTSATCHRKCNFFATNPGCPAGSACTIGGVCSSAAVDGAIVGAACTATAMQGDDCGQESGAARGICVTDSRGLGCYRYCRVAGADCGGGAWECRGVFPTVPQIGVCVDHGVCGDGGADQYASCDACVDAESADCCSVEFAACDLGSPCEILSSCLSACAADDQPCIQACVMATPDGVTPYLDYSRCVVGDAAQGFVGACGGICAQ